MKIKKRQLVTTIYPGQLFSTANLPEGTRFLKWELVGGGDLDDILFDVMEDKFWDMDELIFSDVLHENRTEVVPNKEMYINNVRNATSLVGINIYALIYE
ncbi:hypothetical protein [Bacillus cereus]|uniref:hypothetical protein n=1 Tax=Bacillus cereus TaxID=1396 RepID=UPI000BEC63FC|nr:hypothetical protein [Bacillus cereus]PEE38512.1 hypothetical protein CON59_05060 [Bacillus cereus]PET51739.1 hypothetical protein CN523_02935 [Bacillus cereus]PEV84655.1 hypothetical protein CN429_08310 [Bacillus cereus]PFA44689.1 hypothetical protein CN389_27325 [Bacillus cereus]PFD61415.1 hypothetical protein CN271_28460 [Bacillus cereus]